MRSECCNAEDMGIENGPDYSDLWVCPRCKNNCTFVDYKGDAYIVYRFDKDLVFVFDNGEVFINGEGASESQKYEIEQRINAIGDEGEIHY